MTTPDPGGYAGSHAVLIGVSAYEDPGFPPIRAARNSLDAMRQLLADPALCGWPPEQITIVENPLSPMELAIRLADIAEQTTGVLLLYYVGHGVLTPRGQLCLTVTSTAISRPKITGLQWEDVTEIVHAANCPARVRVAILDCCFAGQPIPETLSSGQEEVALADAALAEGVYTLTATIRNKLAHVVPADQQEESCTTFTGELRDVVHHGIPGRPPWLTLGEIYPVLRHRLQAKGLPLPNQRGTDTADRFPFTANASHPDFDRQKLQPGSPDARARIRPSEPTSFAERKRLAEAFEVRVRTAHIIREDSERARTLAELAREVAEHDLDRAARLFDDAERAIQSITDEGPKMSALCILAKSLATSDHGRAETIAQNITDWRWKASALAEIVKALSVIDPDRAARLFGETERWAQSLLTTYGQEAGALTKIALLLAATDPDRAEHAALAIIDMPTRADTLIAIALEVARSDVDRAAKLLRQVERTIQSIIGQYWGRDTLVKMVKSLSTTHPEWAQQLAQLAIDAEYFPGRELSEIAVSLWAARRFDAAERVAGSITSKYWKSRALSALARESVASDLDRAERIAQAIPGWFSRASTLRTIRRVRHDDR